MNHDGAVDQGQERDFEGIGVGQGMRERTAAGGGGGSSSLGSGLVC